MFRAPHLVGKQSKPRNRYPPPRWGHTAASYEGKIYIFGGRNETDLNDLHGYDIVKNRWVDKYNQDSLVPRARRRHSSVFIGRTMVLFGGYEGNYLNDMYYINVKPFNVAFENSNLHAEYATMVNTQEHADICFLLTNK